MSGWRRPVFGAMVVLAALTGLYFHAHAKRLGESTSVSYKNAPFSIDVFAENPASTITLRAELDPSQPRDALGRLTAGISIDVKPASTVLVTSSEQEAVASTQAARFQRMPSDLDDADPGLPWGRVFPARVFEQPGPGGTYYVATMAIPDGFISHDDAGFSAVLPDLAAHNFLPGVSSIAYLQVDAQGIQPGIYSSYDISGGDPTHQEFTVKGKPVVPSHVFYEPTHVTTQVVLEDSAGLLATSEILTQTPTFDIEDRSNIIWNGSFNLSPVLRLANSAARTKASNDEFLSGIAFATAAAALIALLQEQWPPRCWWRRSLRLSVNGRFRKRRNTTVDQHARPKPYPH